jgi:hypothetical protein
MSSLVFGQLIEVYDSDANGVMFSGELGIVIRHALPGDTFPDGRHLGSLSDDVYMVNVNDKCVFYHQDLLRIPVFDGKFSRKTCKSE